MSERVLIIASHPDDEILGMAGTIAYHKAREDSVSIVFLGNGVGARTEHYPNEAQNRLDCALRAAEKLNAKVVSCLTFPDNQMDTVPLLEIVRSIETVKLETNPTLVYTHHGGDLNIDHRICAQAVLTAFRPQPGESCSEIRAFEINSATEWSVPAVLPPFLPNLFVDVTQYRQLIIESLGCYSEEMRPYPHSRSIEMVLSQRAHRGGQVGCEMAEAFMSVRRILRL